MKIEINISVYGRKTGDCIGKREEIGVPDYVGYLM